MSVSLESVKDLRLYFAYGSNMSPASVKDHGLKMRAVGVGYLEHYKLMFNKISSKDNSIGFANIVPFWGSRVYGVLYDMANQPEGTTMLMKSASDSERLIALENLTINLSILDKKEGYPNNYQRTCVMVKMQNKGVELESGSGRIMPAFTYIAIPEKTSNTNLLITEKYVARINEGFDAYSHGFFKDEEGKNYLVESKELMNIWKTS